MPLDRSDRRRGQEKTEVSQLMSERSTVVICWVEIARMERSDDRMLSDLHHSLPSVLIASFTHFFPAHSHSVRFTGERSGRKRNGEVRTEGRQRNEHEWWGRRHVDHYLDFSIRFLSRASFSLLRSFLLPHSLPASFPPFTRSIGEAGRDGDRGKRNDRSTLTLTLTPLLAFSPFSH